MKTFEIVHDGHQNVILISRSPEESGFQVVAKGLPWSVAEEIASALRFQEEARDRHRLGLPVFVETGDSAL